MVDDLRGLRAPQALLKLEQVACAQVVGGARVARVPARILGGELVLVVVAGEGAARGPGVAGPEHDPAAFVRIVAPRVSVHLGQRFGGEQRVRGGYGHFVPALVDFAAVGMTGASKYRSARSGNSVTMRPVLFASTRRFAIRSPPASDAPDE